MASLWTDIDVSALPASCRDRSRPPCTQACCPREVRRSSLSISEMSILLARRWAMATWHTASALNFPKFERRVKRDFWTALKRFAGRLAFVEDLVAAYYCALDPATPMRVRGILLAALAYFIFRWRYRPLTLLWRGLAFTDDAAVLTALFGLASHIKPVHRAAAARALGKDINLAGI